MGIEPEAKSSEALYLCSLPSEILLRLRLESARTRLPFTKIVAQALDKFLPRSYVVADGVRLEPRR